MFGNGHDIPLVTPAKENCSEPSLVPGNPADSKAIPGYTLEVVRTSKELVQKIYLQLVTTFWMLSPCGSAGCAAPAQGPRAGRSIGIALVLMGGMPLESHFHSYPQGMDSHVVPLVATWHPRNALPT